MHLSQFLENYVSGWTEPGYDPKGFSQLSYVTPVTPALYLQYAQADLASNLKHAHINALSNAKRAIDCQLDNIFNAFGLKKRARFPEKLELVGELGLLAPRIVRKVIKARNLLEHEYYDPPQGEVEDAVDIATLFVEAALTCRDFSGHDVLETGALVGERFQRCLELVRRQVAQARMRSNGVVVPSPRFDDDLGLLT